eukprot:6181479-Alexandrium_andersonii.AAC.1
MCIRDRHCANTIHHYPLRPVSIRFRTGASEITPSAVRGEVGWPRSLMSTRCLSRSSGPSFHPPTGRRRLAY